MKTKNLFLLAVAFVGTMLLAHAALAQPPQPEVLCRFGANNGAQPQAALTLGDDGNFYGTTVSGGSNGLGTVFRMATDGTLTTLHSFSAEAYNGSNDTNADGALPYAALTFGNDAYIYGTTLNGGSGGSGTVFRMTTNGTLTTLHSFSATGGHNGFNETNADGAYANSLTLGRDGNLYGTTELGGSGGAGTVFRITTNGVLTTLVSFANTNGVYPNALALGNDGNLYGTTSQGGSASAGTVFQVTTGGALTTLHSFSASAPPAYTNADGAVPNGLTLGSDGNFYGTTQVAGSGNQGTVFEITTNGTLTTLASFKGANRATPSAAVTFGSDGNLYGPTSSADGNGVIYRLRRGAYLQSFGMVTNGFALNILNVGGTGMVVLESSPDLKVWTPIQTNGPAAAQQFLETAALNQPRKFYRVLQQ